MFANERDNKNYDIFVGGWFSDYNDPLDFLNVMKTGVYDPTASIATASTTA